MRRKKPLGYNKRSKEQRDYDLSFCSKLFLKGYSYRDIVAKLNEDLKSREMPYSIGLSMVFYDLQQMLIEWKRERLDNIDDYVTQELKKLDKIEVELWEAWEASKNGKVRQKNRTSAKPRKVLSEEEKTSDWYGYDESSTETSSGNPRYLDLLLNVQQRRAKLLGFDAPIKIDVPNYPISNEVPSYDIKGIPEDLLFAVVDKIQNLKFDKIQKEKEAKDCE